MLAEGTLRAENFSVATQTTSLPSSTPNKVSNSEPALLNKEEGAAFVSTPADDVVSFGSLQQTQNAQATDTQPETSLLVETADEKVAEATEEALEKERKADKERMEQITSQLNEKLDESLSLRFGHDDKSGKDFFQLIEKGSGDVVRQIPSEDILDFMRKFKDFAGLLFSKQA